MTLNALIAQGGTNIKSPIQRYLDAKKQMAAEDQNRLQQANMQQQMGFRQQQENRLQRQDVRSQQEFNRDIVARDSGAILGLPKKDREQAYNQQIAVWSKQGIPMGGAERYNEHKLRIAAGEYAPEIKKGKRVNVIRKGQVEPTSAIENQQGHYLDTRTGERLFDAIKAPTRQRTAGPGESFDLTKRTAGKLQEGILDSEEFLDSMQSISQTLDGMDSMSQTWVADAGDAIFEGLSRTFGIKFEGDIKEFRSNKQKVRTFTRKVADAYRKMITGAQANKYELKRIEGQMPHEKDSVDTLRTKIKALSEIAEIAVVRKRMALEQGLEYRGRSKDNSLIYYRNGKIVPIKDIQSLGNIKTHEKMRDDIFDEIKENNPELDKKEIRAMAMSHMAAMGYNMRRYRR